MFLLILVLITHSFFWFFSPDIFFVLPLKQNLFDRWFSTLLSCFSSPWCCPSERRQRRRKKKCISIRSCKLNRHHAFAVFIPRESATSDDTLMSVRDPEIYSSHSNLKILSIFQKSLFMQSSQHNSIFNSGLRLHQYKGVADTFYTGSHCWQMLKAKPFIDYQSVITICSIVASRDIQIPRLN